MIVSIFWVGMGGWGWERWDVVDTENQTLGLQEKIMFLTTHVFVVLIEIWLTWG